MALVLFWLCIAPALAHPFSFFGSKSRSALETRDTTVTVLPRTSWTVNVDSFQASNPGTYAIDGSTTTFWHSQYSPTLISLPHNITFDLKATYNVQGLTYLPRQDGNANGRIGRHTVSLSSDNVTWSSPVAFGAFLDDASLKQTNFTATPARYVRLTALTEAGNRGQWTSAAEINILAASTYTAPSTSKGIWGATIDFPIVPVAAVVDPPTGQVITWSSYKANDFSGGSGSGITQTATWNPATGNVSQRTITNTKHDMFCPGLSLDATGRFVVTGGNDADATSFWESSVGDWVAGPGMQIPRGYQSSATLSDGRVFTLGGSWSGGYGGKNGEVYSPVNNTWTLLPGALVAPMLTADAQGIFRQDNHGWFVSWSNGTVFQAGPSKAMNWYYTNGTGSYSAAGTRASDTDSMNGNVILYDAPAGKILTVGGSPSYQDSYATANTHLITIGKPGSIPTVQKMTSMTYARAFANSAILPDGTIFITGGQAYAVPFTDQTPVYNPELWNPKTSSWTILNPTVSPRNYHSVALLLPDGTVFSGGGGLCGSCTTNHFDAQIFYPPYLYTSTGALATRPTISTISATTIRVGSTLTVTTGSTVSSFSLIRYGSATHSVDTDQRRIPYTSLTPNSGTTSTYSLVIPADPGVALPGYWMLFAVDASGVPSLSKTVLVTV